MSLSDWEQAISSRDRDRRQAEIDDLVAQGLTTCQIAHRLVISVRSQFAAWVAGRKAAPDAEPPS